MPQGVWGSGIAYPVAQIPNKRGPQTSSVRFPGTCEMGLYLSERRIALRYAASSGCWDMMSWLRR